MNWKSYVDEFKKFALRGNAFDMAVGIVIGGAFSKIVSSLVNDIIMPLVGLVLGGIDFSNLFISLSLEHYKTQAEAEAAGVPTLNYGTFIQTAIDFIVIAFALFLAIKTINLLRVMKKEDKDKKPSEEVLLLREIRNALKQKKADR